MNSVISFKQKNKNVQEEKKRYRSLGFYSFSERVCDFSLGFWEIGPSDSFGARRKVALCSEAYAWAPVLRSFNKLHELGVSSYLKLHFI